MKMRQTLTKAWRGWVKPILVTAAIVFPLRSSIADWNVVPTGSMKPTIVEGDRIFVNKLAYDLKIPFTTVPLAKWSDPVCGDIVVFFSPADGTRLVKRVIGLPGDTVELRENKVWINGVAASYEPWPLSEVNELRENNGPVHVAREHLEAHSHAVMEMPWIPATRSTGRFTVPAGQYFVLGDNRDNSKDSRSIGCIDRRSIVGKATTVVASLDPENYSLPRGDRFLKELE